jgi:hypothetical protein
MLCQHARCRLRGAIRCSSGGRRAKCGGKISRHLRQSLAAHRLPRAADHLVDQIMRWYGHEIDKGSSVLSKKGFDTRAHASTGSSGH